MKIIFLVIILAFISCGSSEQQIHLTADVPTEVEVGEQFSIKYSINTKVNGGDPSLSEMDGFEVVLGPNVSFSSNTTIINGEKTKSDMTTYTYIFTASKAEILTIPRLTITYAGKEYCSNPLPIDIQPENSISDTTNLSF